MLYAVGTHIDFTKKKTIAEPKESNEMEVGTKVFFVNYLENFDIKKAASNMLVLQPRTI